MNHLSYITIKEPCHQGWDNMSISEKGKFCSACKKEVHDFTNSSIDEIKKAYSESNDGLCGHVPVRILQEQYEAAAMYNANASFVRKFCLAAIFCFGANLFTIDSAKASTLYKIKTAFFKIESSVNDSISVKGVVKDKTTGEKIPFVNIAVFYKDSVVAKSITNLDGEYELKIPKEYSKIDIKAMYPGYVSRLMKGIPVAPPFQTIKLNFDLEMDELILDGMIIMQDEPKILEPTPSEKTIKREEYNRMPK